MSAIAIIPAKGRSSRIPRKNLRLFHGKPIIAYSIEAARESGLFGDDIIVSTDDDEVSEIADGLGARVIRRPHELTLDAVGTQEVTAHALRDIQERWRISGEGWFACCIYPTAPLLDWRDLKFARNAVAAYGARHAYCYSVHGWRDAGQFYFGHFDAFVNDVPLDHWSTMRYDVGPDRFCDINTLDDWWRAEHMYRALHA